MKTALLLAGLVTCGCAYRTSEPTKAAPKYDEPPKNLRSASAPRFGRLNELADALKSAGFTWSDSDGPSPGKEYYEIQKGYLDDIHKTGKPFTLQLTQCVHDQGPFRGERSPLDQGDLIRVGDYIAYWGKDRPSLEDAQAIAEVLRSFQGLK